MSFDLDEAHHQLIEVLADEPRLTSDHSMNPLIALDLIDLHLARIDKGDGCLHLTEMGAKVLKEPAA